MKTEQFIRFGSHNEKKILLEPLIKQYISQKKTGIVINGNVAVHTPAAIAKMLTITFGNCSFFIDPMTYVLTIDPLKYYANTDSMTLKKSMEKLLQRFGRLGQQIIKTKQALQFSDIAANISDLTKNVLEFQTHYIQNSLSQEAMEKKGYSDYEEESDISPKPTFIILPCLYMTLADFDKALKINKTIIQEYDKNPRNDDIETALEIIVEKSVLLDPDKMKQIKDVYSTSKISTLLLWINNFDETSQNEKYLQAYRELLIHFNYKGKKVINLYGGGFSTLLKKEKRLNGIAHGPGYGEYRSVLPVGGGLPTAKFYLPYAQQRMRFEIVDAILQMRKEFDSAYTKKVCGCLKCHEILSPGKFTQTVFAEHYGARKAIPNTEKLMPTSETLWNNQVHFVLNKISEIVEDKINMKNLHDFIEWNKKSEYTSTEHLKIWIKLIQQKHTR